MPERVVLYRDRHGFTPFDVYLDVEEQEPAVITRYVHPALRRAS